MARPATRFSRLSVGWFSSTGTLPDYDAADTGDVLSVTGTVDITGNVTLDGSSTLTVAGQVTADGGLAVGGGTALTAISATTHTVDFGSVTPNGYSTLTVGVSGATYEDVFLVTTPSIWSGADDALSVTARSGDTTGEVDLVCVNSGVTARDATSGTFIVFRVGF